MFSSNTPNGVSATCISVGVACERLSRDWLTDNKLSSLRQTPLGWPVVPDVYVIFEVVGKFFFTSAPISTDVTLSQPIFIR